MSSVITTFAPNVTGLDETSGKYIVKCTWSSEDRARVEPAMYQACAGEFGCPAYGCNFTAHFPNRRPVTNAIYLPEDTDFKPNYWKLGNTESPPEYVEKRSLQVTVLLEEGNSLETCEDTADLVISVGHALLGMFHSCH